MKRLHRPVLSAVAFAAAAAAGCVETPFVYDYPDEPLPPATGTLAAPDPDIIPPVVEGGTQPFSGQVKNYVTGAPVSGALIGSYGLAPPLAGAAAAEGVFSVDVAVQSVFWAKVSGPTFAPVYEKVTTSNAPTENKALYALTSAELDAYATAFGKTQVAGCGVVLVQLVQADTTAAQNVSGIALGGVTSQGPYFLDAAKLGDADLDATSASGRAIFFNVCPTSGTIPVSDAIETLVDVDGAAQLTSIRVFAGGVTLAKITTTPGVVVAPPDAGPAVPTVEFATQVMPIFAQNGCAACHAETGTAAGTGLLFNKTADVVYAKLREGTTRVNLANPSASLLLAKPLLEEPANHPNAAFQATTDVGYVKLLQWIEEGAVYSLTGNPPPPPVVAVDFAADVYPIFSVARRGCVTCHNATDVSGGLDLTGGAGAAVQSIADNNAYDVDYPDRSKLLRNPYCGPEYCAADAIPEVHPLRIFVATTDPDYQTILLWIGQGALYNGAPPPPPGEPLKTNVDFGSEVMIRLQARGCMGCHNAANLSGGLDMTGEPQDVLPRLLLAGENRVVPGSVATSYLLTKPLATAVAVNHGGGKLIPNEQDDFYLYVGGWIAENAPATPAVPLTPIVFATNIYPLFSANGCTGCHGGDGGLTLTGDPAVVRTNILDGRALANDGLPSTSKILTKPMAVYANVNHSGGKLIANTDYAYYKYIQRWLNEGAQ